jgi:hypothetical protein
MEIHYFDGKQKQPPHFSDPFDNFKLRIESGLKGNPRIIWAHDDPRDLPNIEKGENRPIVS